MQTRNRFGWAVACGLATFGATAGAQAPITVGDPVAVDAAAIPGDPDPARQRFHPRVASSGGTRLVVFHDALDSSNPPLDAIDTIAVVRMRASDGAVLGGTTIPIPNGEYRAEAEIAVGGSADTFLVAHTDRTTVYGRRIRASDGAVLDAAPFVISRATGSSPEELAITSDGTNFLVAWTDGRNPSLTPTGANRDVYFNVVTAAGTVADANGKPFATGLDHQSRPTLGWDGSSYVLVFRLWAYGSDPDRLRVRRISAAGAPTGTAKTVVVGATRFELAIGGGRIALVHDGGTTAQPNAIAATVLDASFAVVGTPLALGTTPGDLTGPEVAWSGAGFLATWASSDQPLRTPVQLWGARFTSASVLVDGSPVAIGPAVSNPDYSTGGYYPPAFTTDLAWFSGDRWLVVYPTFVANGSVETHRVEARFVVAGSATPPPVDAGTGGGGGGGGGPIVVCSASPAEANAPMPIAVAFVALLAIARAHRRRRPR